MPLIVHNHYHQRHTHHYAANNEQLARIHSLLENLAKGFAMIAPEVQALLDQAKQSSDVLKSMETHYDALATMIGTLQMTVASLQAGAVLSDTDKATISAQVSDLANTAAAATADITKNTSLEGGNAPAPAGTTPAAPPADPAAPTT